MGLLDKIFGSYSDRELKKIRPIVDRIVGMESEYAALTDAEREMNFTHLNTNNSDVDLCEYNGKTVIVYCSGNQGVTWGGMYCEAVYDGPLDEFLRANFE